MDKIPNQCPRQLRTFIHVLDDGSLLNIFFFYRPIVFDEDEYGSVRWRNWVSERWWYKFVQVCRRWRYLILGSPSHLGLCLVCTRGTPVADMLAHSPELPLIIGHDDYDNHSLTTEDEEGLMLALQHRDRVRRIYLRLRIPSLQKLIMAIDNEFPVLEFMHIAPPVKHNTQLTIPSTFEAPQLRHLVLDHFPSPFESPFLTSAAGLVTLVLRWINPPTYPHPNCLLESLSLLPQLGELEIVFLLPVPNRKIALQLSHIPITTHITLPNLHRFVFRGISAYSEAFLPRLTAPLLQAFSILFFTQLSFSVPRLLQFMSTTQNLEFSSAIFIFSHETVAVWFLRRVTVGSPLYSFYLRVISEHLDWQVSSMAQILNVLQPLFSSVVDVTLDFREHTLSSECHNEINRTLWRKFLGSLGNMKTLRLHSGLVREVSRSLRPNGEPPLELLPGLTELVCPMKSVDDGTFAAFIHEREVAGRPVNLIGEAFPAGQTSYTFVSTTTGLVYTVP